VALASVLVYGTLTSRKGFGMLNAALTHDACPTSVIALVAGRVARSGPIGHGIGGRQNASEQGRLVLMRSVLSDEEEGDAFAAADIVWLGYENFYSLSGVLFQAMASG